MDKRMKIIKFLFALGSIIVLLALNKSLDIGKPTESKIDKQEDLEAVCAIVVMSVY